MPAADRSSIALSTPSPGRRILSRIASPFATKSRSVTDFYIQPDDPHRQYSPGDLVKGSLKLRLLRAVRVTHIVISLHGYAQVFKNPGSPGETNTGYVGTGRGKKSGEYFGNGFASLFEDEVVLCGDGRLEEGSYQFNFELEFPDQDLPSSIDFERGTISYMITATMTRPTTISPTVSCDRKIYFVERIDISPLYPPKARTITLEPVSRRSRAKDKAKHKAKRLVDQAERKNRNTDSGELSGEGQQDARSIAPSTLAESEPPLTPSESAASFESAVTGSARTSQPSSSAVSPGNSSDTKTTNRSSQSGKIIHTNIETLVGGCLRGDSVPVRVSVNHTKHIKSMNGVIVTLYRQARVDMHPAIPLGPTEKGENRKYEDYYPKSMTGLGGLSLSGAGSSHIFRKDLSQSVQPLIVNPETLNATVTVKVKVPEDCFPTISTVPGAMISFKYFVEVVVDIQGKLAAPERALSNLGGLANAPITHHEDLGTDGERNGNGAFGPYLVDTAPVRRDKGVVSCTFEVVIGTRDSERRKGKRRVQSPTPVDEPPPEPAALPPEDLQRDPRDNDYASYPPQDHWDYAAYGWGHGQYYGDGQNYYHEYAYDQPPAVPMPQLPDESQLPEKERLRRQEERLLPSQPPGTESQAEPGAHEATAPVLPEDFGEPSHAQPSSSAAPAYQATPAAASSSAQPHSHDETAPAPVYSPGEGSSSTVRSPGSPVDDKQELQRRRLEMEASAPPPPDEEDTAGSVPMEDDVAPTAPPADGYHCAPLRASGIEHDSHGDAAGELDLPTYER